VGGSWIYWGLKRRKLLKLKEKFFQQNGGLMLQQQLSNHKTRGLRRRIKSLVQKSSKRPPTTTTRVESLAKEAMELFTKEYYQITKWLPLRSPKLVIRAKLSNS
jgi:hypothetical protein